MVVAGVAILSGIHKRMHSQLCGVGYLVVEGVEVVARVHGRLHPDLVR